MSSPVHRLLFSPPGSPTNFLSSPTFDALSLTSIRDFLLPPTQPRDGDIHPDVLSPKQSSPSTSFGPGGFFSTRAYPSRLSPSTPSSRTAITSLAHRKPSLSQPTNIPTSHPLTSPSFLPVPKPLIRTSILMLLILACTFLIAFPASYTLQASHATAVKAEQATLEMEGVALPSAVILRQLRRERGKTHRAGKGQLLRNKGRATQRLMDVEGVPNRAYRSPPSSRPLPPHLELMAIQSYLLEDPTNTLSKDLDGSEPVDAYSVLGMVVNDRVMKDLQVDVHPVVVWEMGDVWTTPIKTLLDLYALDPAPLYLPLNGRPDLPILEAILSRLAPSSETPIPLVVIGGKAIGGYEALLKLHKDDVLHLMLEKGGAQVDGRKIKEQKEEEKVAKRREVRQAVVPRK